MSGLPTYTAYIPDDLVRAVGVNAALLACRLDAFADEKGAIYVSFSYLADLWNMDKRQIVKAAQKLDLMRIWHYEKHHGRGHVTEWKKGTNFVPFMTLKKVQNLQIKGTKNVPNNKDYNKDRLISAHAREINQSKRGLINAGDTPAPPEIMDLFNQFWQAFFFGTYAKYEKEQSAYRERAEAAWRYLSDEKRERLLKDINAGRRWDKTHWILWYIQNYEIPLTIWYGGDPELKPEMVSQLQLIKYKGRVAYCKPEDKDAWIKRGAKVFNN